MKILTCGDVVGRKGRSAIMEYVPKLRSELQLDAVIVNGENAAGGFGITQEIATNFSMLVSMLSQQEIMLGIKSVLTTFSQKTRDY